MTRPLRRHKIFTCRLPTEQWQKIFQEAEDNERSVSAHFRIIIRKYFEGKKKQKKGGE